MKRREKVCQKKVEGHLADVVNKSTKTEAISDRMIKEQEWRNVECSLYLELSRYYSRPKGLRTRQQLLSKHKRECFKYPGDISLTQLISGVRFEVPPWSPIIHQALERVDTRNININSNNFGIPECLGPNLFYHHHWI